LLRYLTRDGQEPFGDWLNGLADPSVQARIRLRLARLECGNFGDCASIGSGVFELRDHSGPGYRIYFGKAGRNVVLLLTGGSKRREARDIQMALASRQDWKDRQA
jgi:putative addiction module killer protein